VKGTVVWITGLPSSGKSRLAGRVSDALRSAAKPCLVLDSDAVRAALEPPPGYDERAREDFYATLANLAAMFARQGLTVLVPATAHRRIYRERARERAPRFLEVYVSTSAEECAERDAKGLYAAARDGRISGLPGVGVAYEAPEAPDIVACGGEDEEALRRIVEACLC
jgi:adenylylsulfate kinase